MDCFVARMTSVMAKDTARLFRQNVFRLRVILKNLVSGRDFRFTSHFWKEVCSLLGIEQGMLTALHPQSDGQT